MLDNWALFAYDMLIYRLAIPQNSLPTASTDCHSETAMLVGAVCARQ